jgi:ATP-dependent RNA helicase RhlB
MSQHPLTDITFESFDLHPRLLAGLNAAGFTRCTPIQALTLPIALIGRDVAGQAQTGTGKTAAFLVAVLNRLLMRPPIAVRKLTDPRAVIVAPTRELAIQIDKDFRTIGRDTGLTSALIYGGVDYEKQRDSLKAGCDLIIATPGRLIDYLKQHVFSLNAVEAVVIDEADRMFDLGFIKDIRFLMRRMPPREERQSMLFSATLSHRVLELAYEHMNNPEKLTVEADTVTADRVRQVVYFPAKEEKLPLLLNLLSRIENQRGIIFINTKITAEKITHALEKQGYGVALLSGDVPQAKRERMLGKFQRGEIELLVATDVAARGLHIPNVSHVFNYDLPQDAEDYVHRIGRTARLGAEGDAISFACDLYAMSLPDIEAYIEQKIPTAPVTADLLIAPSRHVHKAPVAAVNTDEEAVDDARNTAGAPPKSGRSRRLSGPRSGGSDTRRPQHGEPRQRERQENRAASRRDGTAATSTAETVNSQTPSTVVDGVPRKRRRRGGRRHRRDGVEANAGAVRNEGRDAAQPTHAPERKPRREHASRMERAAPAHPAPSMPAPAAVPPKPGFFRRIARFFGSR